MYMYSTHGGVATLNKGDDSPLKTIGKFKTETEALAACKAHYMKASAFLERMGKPVPKAIYI